MKEVDVASDWRVDPVLKNACQEVVTSACDPSLGTDHVMVSQNVLSNTYVDQHIC